MSFNFDKPEVMTEKHLLRTIAFDKNDSITESRKQECREELVKRWYPQQN